MAEQNTERDPQVDAIMKGFREQYPDYADMSDDDVMVNMYQTHYSDMEPKEYLTAMQTKFAPDYKPFRLQDIPGEIAKGFARSVAAPITAVKEYAGGRQLEKIASNIPAPNLDELYNKGYSDQQVHNVLKGYADTQRSLMGDIETAGKEGAKAVGEGAAFYATLPITGGPLAPASQTGKIVPALAHPAMKLASTTGISALLGAAYGAIDEGIVKGSEVAANGGSANDILSEVTKASLHGGGQGLMYGAAGGAVLHGLGSAIGKGARTIGDGITAARMKLDPNWAARIHAAEAGALKNRSVALKQFADTFKPQDLMTRFKPDFDYWQSVAAAQGTPPEHLASNIVSKLYGEDAMMADPAAIKKITDKIIPWLETQDKLAGPFPEVPQFPTGSAMGLPQAGGALPNEQMAATMPLRAVPPGADLSAQGGLAPDMTPPALRGPVSQPTAPEFVPPAPGTIEPLPGIEPVNPTAVKPPFQLQGVEPELQPRPAGEVMAPGSPAASMRTPIDIEKMPPVQPTEIAPRLPEAPLPPAGEGKPAGRIEPIELPKGPSYLQPVRESGEGPSLGLPTVEVENVTRAINESGPAIPGQSGTTRKIEGALADVVPSADGTHVIIKSLKGAEHGAGVSGKALDKIISTADAAGAPLQVTATDYAGPRGGKIPANKIAEWYEKRGFKRTGDESIGAITLVRPVRATGALTPEQQSALFEHHFGDAAERGAQLDSFLERTENLSPKAVFEATGNVTEGKPFIGGEKPSMLTEIGGKLDAAAEGARTRLQSKLGRLQTGFDPTALGDLAIIGAAKMYRLGLTRFKPWAEEMVKDFGEGVRSGLQKVFAQSQKFLRDRMEKASSTFATANKLLGMANDGKLGAGWYDKTKSWAEATFGDDADMFLRFLSATSAGMRTDANVTLALKAYAQWKMGLPFDEFLGVHKLMLERAVRGESFGDRKIQSILQALRGDDNAVVIDTRVMRALGFKNAGIGKKVGDSVMGGQTNLTGPQYALFENVIRDLAKQAGMTPREFQAALWTHNKISAAHEAATMEGTAGRKAMNYAGNFRPYEDIAEGNLRGLSPLEWVEKNRIRYEQLAAASEGVAQTRGGGGFTYDPYTFKPLDQKDGIVVSLMSKKLPTSKLTGSEVIDFAKKFKELTDTYEGLNVGTFNLDNYEKGQSSIDFNMVLPKEMLEKAKELGKARKQLALWDLAASEEIPTGYTGKSAESKAVTQKTLDELRTLLEDLKVPKRTGTMSNWTMEAMAEQPHRWAQIASEALNVSDEQLRKLVAEGKFTPATDQDLVGKAVVHRDGSVWEYRDPTADDFNIMKRVGSFREKGSTVKLLDYLADKEVLSGNDVAQSYRSQAGFLRLDDPSASTRAVLANQNNRALSDKIADSMVKAQGTRVDLRELKDKQFSASSIWISPNGHIIEVPNHLTNAARVIKAQKLKNPVPYEGYEHESIQRILNQGFIRVQLHRGAFAADATAPLTDAQIVALRTMQGRLGPDRREFAGRVCAPNGQHRDFFNSERALNEFIEASQKGLPPQAPAKKRK